MIWVLAKEGRIKEKKKQPKTKQNQITTSSKYSSFLLPTLILHTKHLSPTPHLNFPHVQGQVILEPSQEIRGSTWRFFPAALYFLMLFLCSSTSPPWAAVTQRRSCSGTCGPETAIPLGCPCPSVGDDGYSRFGSAPLWH